MCTWIYTWLYPILLKFWCHFSHDFGVLTIYLWEFLFWVLSICCYVGFFCTLVGITFSMFRVCSFVVLLKIFSWLGCGYFFVSIHHSKKKNWSFHGVPMFSCFPSHICKLILDIFWMIEFLLSVLILDTLSPCSMLLVTFSAELFISLLSFSFPVSFQFSFFSNSTYFLNAIYISLIELLISFSSFLFCFL